MANNNIGPKRLVVGAHYGVKDWLVQRVTAVLMVVYTAVLFFLVFTSSTPSYEGWAALFAQQWFKLFSAVTLLALFYHAWVGVRDIWMDYIKPVGLRLFLQIATIGWLVACAAWSLQILWSV